MDKQIPEQLSVTVSDIKEKKKFIILPDQEARDLYEMASRRPVTTNDGSRITVHLYKCVGCGVCSMVCPVGNFSINDKKSYCYRKTCKFCIACAHQYLQKAITIENAQRKIQPMVLSMRI